VKRNNPTRRAGRIDPTVLSLTLCRAMIRALSGEVDCRGRNPDLRRRRAKATNDEVPSHVDQRLRPIMSRPRTCIRTSHACCRIVEETEMVYTSGCVQFPGNVVQPDHGLAAGSLAGLPDELVRAYRHTGGWKTCYMQHTKPSTALAPLVSGSQGQCTPLCAIQSSTTAIDAPDARRALESHKTRQDSAVRHAIYEETGGRLSAPRW
jgi:hypothetical protein